MSIKSIPDFTTNYSEFYSDKNWISLPLKENEITNVTDSYGDKKYLIIETRERPLYSNIDLIRRRCLGIVIPFCLGAITFIITSLVTQSPLVKIVSLISSIAIPFFISFVRGLFFQKIETCSVGIQMDANKELLLTLFGKKMIEALGGFDAVSKLRNDWDGMPVNMKKGIEYGFNDKDQLQIGFSFLRYNSEKNNFEREMAAIRKTDKGWKVIRSQGFIRILKFDGQRWEDDIINRGTPEEKELLERIARFTNREALSSFDISINKEEELFPEEGKTNIYILNHPHNDFNKINKISNFLRTKNFT